ncbi:TIGR03619 family F420-dependent LLM class oxidoreductase [Frankia sp. R82]|uniref:TIGR03619 family F420-dependent LLM class oxidoreductase n=1 Tax=Frankia sp. R82 TaxID=2950553 RepID=UPI0020439834|nr:TIGR03619 family F420-dependent LLM class oxidoreductase [Frankia sp. R82]MCM3882614.1 TIGR03619 family F420-dependent LLM class oxidoreductase [Frankia sp. R82]
MTSPHTPAAASGAPTATVAGPTGASRSTVRSPAFAVHLGSVNPRAWVDVAVEADRLGFESVWVPEHVVVPIDTSGSPFAGADHPPIPPNVPVHDAMAMLSFIAARTTNITIGTNVFNLGLRHPFLTARAATTVDILSGGRLALGVGASWLRAEWEALNLDFDTRGARIDETLDVLRRLWTEEVVEHHGRFFDFGPVTFEPRSTRPGGPALHIGGDGPAALRRAATFGTGWMPMNHTLEQLPASLERLGALTERAGRTEPLEITVHGQVQRPEDVEPYVEAGVTRIIVQAWTRSREAIEGMRRFAENVIVPLGAH